MGIWNGNEVSDFPEPINFEHRRPIDKSGDGSGRHAKNYDGSVDRLPSTDSGADENLKSEFMTHGFGFEV